MAERQGAVAGVDMTKIDGCRACGSAALAPVLSLGETPLANALRTAEQLAAPEPRFPLELVRCTECTLVQITETVPPEVLFSDYVYFSSYSEGMVAHARELAGRLTTERGLGAGDLVVEIASNDGYLLQFYQQAGVPVLGIEPAANVAEVARTQRNIPTRTEFFGEACAERLAAEGVRASVIHANNVLAHVADLDGFVRGLRRLVADRGVVCIEVPHVADFLEKTEFDTVYHEHLCYFSLTSLVALFARHDLCIVDVEKLALHGGSLLVSAVPAAAARGEVRAVAARGEVRAVAEMLAAEAAMGIGDAALYDGFAARVVQLRASLRELLTGLRAQGQRIAAYGAAAKGATLLNYCGIGPDLLDFVVDRSPHKQGKYLPGVAVPIRAPEALEQAMPDFTLLLSWNFADEIMRQQAGYLARGGRFIVPVPEPRVL